MSVRNAHEASLAIEGGADWIDAKDPDRGSLGSVDIDSLREIAAACAAHRNRLQISAALGELVDMPSPHQFVEVETLTLVKVGVAQLGQSIGDLTQVLASWLEMAPSKPGQNRPGIVLAAYADSARADAPDIRDVCQAAIQFAERGVVGLLIDTCVKDGSNLLDHAEAKLLRDVVEQSRDAGLMTALAGSLTIQTIPEVAAIRPHIVAVRGAACESSDRRAWIAAERVAKIKHLLQAATSCA